MGCDLSELSGMCAYNHYTFSLWHHSLLFANHRNT